MNAYDVLTDHHKLLHQLGERMLAAPPGTAERQRYIDGLLVACDPSATGEVLDVFGRHGFGATVIGEAAPGRAGLAIV